MSKHQTVKELFWKLFCLNQIQMVHDGFLATMVLFFFFLVDAWKKTGGEPMTYLPKGGVVVPMFFWRSWDVENRSEASRSTHQNDVRMSGCVNFIVRRGNLPPPRQTTI